MSKRLDAALDAIDRTLRGQAWDRLCRSLTRIRHDIEDINAGIPVRTQTDVLAELGVVDAAVRDLRAEEEHA